MAVPVPLSNAGTPYLGSFLGDPRPRPGHSRAGPAGCGQPTAAALQPWQPAIAPAAADVTVYLWPARGVLYQRPGPRIRFLATVLSQSRLGGRGVLRGWRLQWLAKGRGRPGVA